MNIVGVTPEELLSTLTGEPTQETLAKIEAALADPKSEIHDFLRAYESFATLATNPDEVDWAAYVLPAEITEAKEEMVRRSQIQEILGELNRFYLRPDSPIEFPPTRSVVDAICGRLDWFRTLDDAGKAHAYEIAGEEVAILRERLLATVAETHVDGALRTTAHDQARRISRRRDCLTLIAQALPDQARALRLAENAGRYPTEIASMLKVTEDTAEQYLREARAELQILDKP